MPSQVIYEWDTRPERSPDAKRGRPLEVVELPDARPDDAIELVEETYAEAVISEEDVRDGGRDDESTLDASTGAAATGSNANSSAMRPAAPAPPSITDVVIACVGVESELRRNRLLAFAAGATFALDSPSLPSDEMPLHKPIPTADCPPALARGQ